MGISHSSWKKHMLSTHPTTNFSADYPEQETPLGLFFSTNDPQSKRSKISLRLSPTLRKDSLFIKQIHDVQQVDEELTEANIFFPEGVHPQQDAVSWPVDHEHSQSFEDFCQEQQSAANLELRQSVLLKLCHMLHLVHYHNLAAYPISSDMIRISDQGDPLMLLLPAFNLEAMSESVKQAFFHSQFSAPETLSSYAMDPHAFTYNLGVLTALLSGFTSDCKTQDDHLPQIKSFYTQLLAWIQQSENPQASGALQTLMQQSLQQDPSSRPFCPMQIFKGLGGTACVDCRENPKQS
jgi:hypothetical protein